MKKISIVVPMFNESDGIDGLFSEIVSLASHNNMYLWELVAVNDGSTDNTLSLLYSYESELIDIVVVDLSRNFGKEYALSAGLSVASGDAVIPIDADLQDPPQLIPAMIQEWEKGFDVILAKRIDRSSDSFFKRTSSLLFYKSINLLSDVHIPENVGDFRLMDRVVINVILQLPENRRFMKGIFAWAGFRTKTLEYTREARSSGLSKFNAWKLWNFAIEGITSFSIAPLKIWSYLGFILAILVFIYGIYISIRTFYFGVDIPGYASLIVSILTLSSIQLIGIGIIGEYIGRIYMESKNRPAFIIRSVIKNKNFEP